jgi:hypothetical protein
MLHLPENSKKQTKATNTQLSIRFTILVTQKLNRLNPLPDILELSWTKKKKRVHIKRYREKTKLAPSKR